MGRRSHRYPKKIRSMTPYPPNTWRCSYCKKIKPLDQFPSKRSNIKKDGTRSPHPVCAPCGVAHTTTWVKKNRSKYNNYQRAYHKAYCKLPHVRKRLNAFYSKRYYAMKKDPVKYAVYLVKKRIYARAAYARKKLNKSSHT